MNTTATTPPAAGARVKFTADGRRWWNVRAADARYAVCTRQAEFRPKGAFTYTIVDTVEGIRGTTNLIGQGWRRGMTDEDCADLLAALQSGDVGVSHRNRVPLDLEVPA